VLVTVKKRDELSQDTQDACPVRVAAGSVGMTVSVMGVFVMRMPVLSVDMVVTILCLGMGV
jgi:hypothetical protein